MVCRRQEAPIAYALTTRDTFAARMHGAGIAALNSTSQYVEIDVATGTETPVTWGRR